nr:MAG TPA: hypothetical protein [Caudoviricetes sp.]
MVSFHASAVAVVNISLMKMVTVMVTVVTAELESTGQKKTTIGRVQILICQNMECCTRLNIKMVEKIRLF